MISRKTQGYYTNKNYCKMLFKSIKSQIYPLRKWKKRMLCKARLYKKYKHIYDPINLKKQILVGILASKHNSK